MQIHRYGPDALLVEVEDAAAALALYHAARRHDAAAGEVVPAARTVLFAGVADLEGLEAEIRGWPRPDVTAAEARVVEVPTTYDGADLETVARHWDMTVDEAVATHTSLEFTVAFCGFAPGFAYCAGLPDHLHVPRHADPRSRVPAGSVGLAGEFTGVYPTASPGGWQVIGRTVVELWVADREDPALLPPGTRVRFVRA